MPLRVYFKDREDMQKRIMTGNLYHTLKRYLMQIMEEEKSYPEKLNEERLLHYIDFQFDNGVYLGSKELEFDITHEASQLKNIIRKIWEELSDTTAAAPQTIERMQMEILREVQSTKSEDIHVAMQSDSVFVLVTKDRHYVGAYLISSDMKAEYQRNVYDAAIEAIRRA